RQFYIDGKWVSPVETQDFEVINPATEEVMAVISLGSSADVHEAVTAARKAFASYSETTVAERAALLRRIIEIYRSRMDQIAETSSREMGAPMSLWPNPAAAAGLGP